MRMRRSSWSAEGLRGTEGSPGEDGASRGGGAGRGPWAPPVGFRLPQQPASLSGGPAAFPRLALRGASQAGGGEGRASQGDMGGSGVPKGPGGAMGKPPPTQFSIEHSAPGYLGGHLVGLSGQGPHIPARWLVQKPPAMETLVAPGPRSDLLAPSPQGLELLGWLVGQPARC